MLGKAMGTENQLFFSLRGVSPKDSISYASNAVDGLMELCNVHGMYGPKQQYAVASWGPNGGKIEPDISHIEAVTPEYRTGDALACGEYAQRFNVANIVTSAHARERYGDSIIVVPHSTDHSLDADGTAWNTAAYHLNLTAKPGISPERVLPRIYGFAATMQLIAGNGVAVRRGLRDEYGGFCISGRALSTCRSYGTIMCGTLSRYIGENRNNKGVLQIACWDPNVKPGVTALKADIANLVYWLLETGWKPPPEAQLKNPASETVRIAKYPDLTYECRTKAGLVHPLDIQWAYYNGVATKLMESDVPDEDWRFAEETLVKWEDALIALEKYRSGSHEAAEELLDWPHKRRLAEGEVDVAVRIDDAYTAVNPVPGEGYDKSILYSMLKKQDRVRDVERAMREPPRDTRAYARGTVSQAIARAADASPQISFQINWGNATCRNNTLLMPDVLAPYEREAEQFIESLHKAQPPGRTGRRFFGGRR